MTNIYFKNNRGQVINFSKGGLIRQSYDGFFDSNFSIKTEQGVNQFGATVTNRKFEPKTLEIQFALNLLTEHQLRNKKKELMDVLNPGVVTGTLVYENISGDKFEIDCEVSNLSMPSGEARGKNFQITIVSFLAPDPRFKKSEMKIVRLENGNHTIVNKGTVGTPVKLEISGPTSRPIISNITENSNRLVFNSVLEEYQKLEIISDYGKKAIYLIDTDTGVKRKAMRLLDLDSSFFNLHAGENRLLVKNCDNGITISFYERFLEVY